MKQYLLQGSATNETIVFTILWIFASIAVMVILYHIIRAATRSKKILWVQIQQLKVMHDLSEKMGVEFDKYWKKDVEQTIKRIEDKA